VNGVGLPAALVMGDRDYPSLKPDRAKQFPRAQDFATIKER